MIRIVVLLLCLSSLRCVSPSDAGNVSAAESPAVFSDAEITRIREVLRHIFRLEYDQAKNICDAMIRERPEDPVGYVYLARTYWSDFLNRNQALSIYRFAADDFFVNYNKYKVRVDPASEQMFRDVTRTAIEKSRNALKKNSRDLRVKYLLGVAYQNLASFEATVTHGWWSSFMNGDKNVKQHREVQKRAPAFADAALALAVYDYVAASVSWKIRWLSVLLGHPGSKSGAKAELERVVAEAKLVNDDGRTVLAVLYTRDREYEKALAKLQELRAAHPTNYLLHLEIADMYVRMKRFDSAIVEYSNILGMTRSNALGYGRMEKAIVRNHMGLAQRAFRKFGPAESEFRVVLDDPAASAHSRLTARLELAKTLDLGGNRSQAVDMYRALTKEDPFGFYRKEAETWLEKPYTGL
jgi:tetratricopeptide (TPR) repeat protein